MISGLLPIGTIVTLNGIEPKIMIMGYMPVEVGNEENEHEYSGVVYPVGYMKPDEIVQFDAKDIRGIHFVGLQNVEQMEFEQYILEDFEDEDDDEYLEDDEEAEDREDN